MSSLYLLDSKFLLDTWLANIFLHSAGFLFILLTAFAEWKLFSLVWSYSLSFVFVEFPFDVKYKKSLPEPMSGSLAPQFSFRSFMVSGLALESLICSFKSFNLIVSSMNGHFFSYFFGSCKQVVF